ncbi:MAG: PKD domain-containing protein [Bacteroidota bacterium]|nr:PKD domain-containing protein [Bacteroidota bacterium]
MKCRFFFILFLFTLISFKGLATHIVGGEIYYDRLGGNNYRITLKIYRDCSPGTAGFDSPATIFVFNSSGTFVDSVEIPFPGSVILPVTINNPCFTAPTNICVEEAVYQTVMNLPPIPGGYDLTYQRCCRNGTILNLILPGDVGSTYTAHIPDNSVAPGNSSPRYTLFPPIFLCEDVPLQFDHSATDPDGDSLYYEICAPFAGLDPLCPSLGVAAAAGCPVIPLPPPYSFVPWSGSYNAAFPMSAFPAISINPVTGLMTGKPNMIGQWVVGVCVSEYRSGVLIDVNKRDFQFNVVNCPGLPVASIPDQSIFCFGMDANFTESSLNAFSYHWDFGVSGTLADTSNSATPSYVFPDSGSYLVTLIINPGSPCADTNSSTYYIYPLLQPDFIVPPGECDYSNSFELAAGGDYMGNGTFSWNFGSAANPVSSSLQNPGGIVFDSAGTYPVSLTISENGCSETVIHDLIVHPQPLAYYGLASSVACDLQPVHFIDSSQGAKPFTYQWTFGDGATVSGPDPYHTFPSVGTFPTNMILTSALGCCDTFSLPAPLTVYPSPVAGFTVSPMDTSIFYPEVTVRDLSIGAIDCTIYWGDGSMSTNCDSVHSYSRPGTYTIMQVVLNASGCYDTAYQEVLIRPEYLFFIPNAFTPNGSGMNDVFKPVLLGVHNYHFMIFNRWGEKIFETKDTEEGWNGVYKGSLSTNDVFVYRIFFRDDVQNLDHEFIGHVTVVR